jgi:hypothetical protein
MCDSRALTLVTGVSRQAGRRAAVGVGDRPSTFVRNSGALPVVAVVVFDVEVLDTLRRTGPANHHPHIVAALDQLPRHMRAEEPLAPITNFFGPAMR